MSILFISGSNRKGNTERTISYLSSNIKLPNEVILLRERNIEFCKGCLICHEKPECVIKDDMKQILSKMRESELIVFGVPNYFDNVTGLFKNFIDRLHPAYKSEILKGRRVLFIFIGGGEEEGTLEELDVAVAGMNKYLQLNRINSYAFKALNINDNLDYGLLDKILKEMQTILVT